MRALRGSGAPAASLALLALACLALPLANRYIVYLCITLAVVATGALALNLLTGVTGQISLAQGGLLGVGAYTAGLVVNAGGDLLLALAAAGLASTLAGLVVGMPALRLRGLYFAMATLAAQAILEYLFRTLPFTGGTSGMLLGKPRLLGLPITTDLGVAYVCLVVLALTFLGMRSLMRTNPGRAFRAIRESEIAAEVVGVDVYRFKLWSFALSSFFAGLAGALLGFSLGIAHPEAFTLDVSVQYIAVVIVGGLGALGGAFWGALFVVLLPELLQRGLELTRLPFVNVFSAIREIVFGLMIVLFLIFEPRGLAALLGRVRLGGARGAPPLGQRAGARAAPRRSS